MCAVEDWMTRTGLLPVALAALLIGGCSKNETPKPDPASVGAGGAGATLKDDADFVRDVALKNLAEIELSRMALSKATGPDVKAFAQMMVDDHGAAADKLKSVVSGQQVEWPAQLDEKHRETAEELAKKQGAEFDREYVEAMV